MSDFLEEYKGYTGSVHYRAEDEVCHGKLEGIRDLVTYEGTDAASLKSAFHEAVDDYLETCRRNHKAPDTPFKGVFNVRVGAKLHKRAACYAAEHDKKLNSVMSEALEQYLEAAAH